MYFNSHHTVKFFMVSNEGRVRYEPLFLFDSISFMELRQTDIEIVVENEHRYLSDKDFSANFKRMSLILNVSFFFC